MELDQLQSVLCLKLDDSGLQALLREDCSGSPWSCLAANMIRKGFAGCGHMNVLVVRHLLKQAGLWRILKFKFRTKVRGARLFRSQDELGVGPRLGPGRGQELDQELNGVCV